MLVYPKPRLPITGAGISQPASASGPPTAQGTPQAPGVGQTPPPTTNTGMQQNQGGMPRQQQVPTTGQGGPSTGTPVQNQPPNPLLGNAAMSPAGQNYGSGSGQWGRVTDRHPGGYVGAGSGTWEQSYKQQQPLADQTYNRLGARPGDVQQGKPGANVAVAAISENMANAGKYALAPSALPNSNLSGGASGGQGPGSLTPPPGTSTHDANPVNYPQGDGTATSQHGLTNDQGRSSYQNGENGLSDPGSYPDRTTQDGRPLKQGTDGKEYAYDYKTQTWTQYTNIKGYDPNTGIPYNQTLMDAWNKDNSGTPITAGKVVNIPNGGAPGGYEHYKYTPDTNGNPGWTPVDDAGRPLNGPQGTAPQGASGDRQPAQGFPDGYTTDGNAIYDQNGMAVPSGDLENIKHQASMDQMIKGLGNTQVPQMSREGLDAQTKANDASFAAKSADAMRAALVASARGGASPEFQSGQLADVAQKGGLAGAQANAQAKLQYDVQNFQAQIQGYDAKLKAIEMAAQFAHDDASQARLMQLQKQLEGMRNDAQMKLAQYQAQLQKPGAGDYAMGALSLLPSLFGLL